jgi:hypothetical protein
MFEGEAGIVAVNVDRRALPGRNHGAPFQQLQERRQSRPASTTMDSYLELVLGARPPFVLAAELADTLAREGTDETVLLRRTEPVRRTLAIAGSKRDVYGLTCVVEVEKGRARSLDIRRMLLCPFLLAVHADEEVRLAVR